MRLELVMALVSCAMLVAHPVALADDLKSYAPVQTADLAKGKTPAIAYGGGSLNVAYQNDASIFYVKSSDGGKSWSAPAKISGAGISCYHPAIAAGADGSVNIVFQAKSASEKAAGVFYVRSVDAGKIFSEPVDISTTPTESSEPQLAIGTDNSLHVVWIDALPAPAGPDVFYTASTDGGKTWSRRENLSNTPGGISSNPAIAVGSDATVHVAWVDTSSGEEQPDIFYVYKSGKSWTKPQDLSKDSGFSALPSIACGPGSKVYIAWTDNSKKIVGDIWCLIAQGAGRFGKPINLSDTRGISSQPAISVDPSDRLAAVWIDTSSTLKVPDIWARTGYQGSLSSRLQLFQSKGESMHPSITIAEKTAYAVWEEVEAGASTLKGCSLKLK